MLALTRRIDEEIIISCGGEVITLKLLSVKNNRAILGFDSNKKIAVWRKELTDEFGRILPVVDCEQRQQTDARSEVWDSPTRERAS